MPTPFETAVHLHQRRIYSFAHYFLGNPQEAEDVTQEVLIRFWRHHDRLEEQGVGSWLIKVTRNACFDRLRKRRSTSRVFVGDVDMEVVETAPGSEPSPERKAQDSDFRRRLEAAITRLDEPYRSVVVLREIQGLKYREISEALEMPLNTVRVYLHRGRRKLRDDLGEVMGNVSAE